MKLSQPARLAVLFALLVATLPALWFRSHRQEKFGATQQALATNALETVKAFEEREAQKYWGPEIKAEKYGRVIEQLWDRVNAATNKAQALALASLESIQLGVYTGSSNYAHGIHVADSHEPNHVLSAGEWQVWCEKMGAQWKLSQCEFRHNAFTPATKDQPASSRYYFSAHLDNSPQEQRAILEGDLRIAWAGSPDSPRLGAIDASALQVRWRQGVPAFRKILDEDIEPMEGSYFIDPLIVWDLDGDGIGEIVLAAKNRVYHRDERGAWSASNLCEHDPGLIFTAVLGDFNGDGNADFLCAKFDGLFLYAGTADGRFPNAPRQVWTAQPRLKYAQAVALGDIDGDGDIDLFLGQYKVPYEKGQMPRPYFDANDGNPSFLLQNDGKGNFIEITQKAGLGAKRGRRIYNASLIDLNGDGNLDLLTVSDFAGLDAYENDGTGRFNDATARWFPEREGLGMADCFADFNRDGKLDVLMIGMNSPTADRLASLNLARPYDRPDEGMRSRVTVGNRLLLGSTSGRFAAGVISQAVAHTGWSWGCVADDFDNDGFPDIYIANGHESRASVREYEPEFWLHDIYVGDSTENSLAQLYFREKMAATRGRGWSYGGYEKNRFFLNLGGTNFLECAYLFGVALENDSRNVVAEDLDGDGREDLVVTTFEVFPRMRQTLKIFHNELPLENRFPTLLVRDLKASGKVLRGGSDPARAILSSGSYRSQTQPRVRAPRAELERIKNDLDLQIEIKVP